MVVLVVIVVVVVVFRVRWLPRRDGIRRLSGGVVVVMVVMVMLVDVL